MTPGFTPRPAQVRGIEQLRAGFRAGHRRGVLVMPTGAGKSCASWMMADPSIAQGKRVVFLADRRVLVKQAAESAQKFGLPVGIVMSDAPWGWRDPAAPLQVMSKDTAAAWLKASAAGERRPDLPPADFLIVDECHRGSGPSWEFVRAAYPDAWEVGLSATPCYPNGKALGTRYGFMAQPTTYAELIGEGTLVEPKCFAPGAKVTGKTGKKPTGKDLVGDPVFWWKTFAPGLRTFCFCSGVDHSMAVRDEFRAAGIPAEHLDGNTPDRERDVVLASLASGATLVVCNCNVTRYGVDIPAAACCQLLAPMTSPVDYRQSCGRVLRSAPCKDSAVIIDHAGAVLWHGLPHADVPWTLEGDADHVEIQRKRMESGEAPMPVACRECHTLYSGPNCPNCGWKPQRQPKAKATRAGTLERVTDACGAPAWGFDDLRREWHRTVAIAAHKGMKLSQAAAIFRSTTGQTPTAVPGLEPLPSGRDEWNQKTGDVFPDFCRRKAGAE